MRWKDGVKRQNLHFGCLISVCQRKFNLVLHSSSPFVMQPPGNLALIRYMCTTLSLFWTPLFSKILSCFPFFKTPLIWTFISPLLSLSRPPLLLAVVAGRVFQTNSFKMCNCQILLQSEKHQQKDIKGKGPSQNGWGTLGEGSQNRLPAGPFKSFLLWVNPPVYIRLLEFRWNHCGSTQSLHQIIPNSSVHGL